MLLQFPAQSQRKQNMRYVAVINCCSSLASNLQESATKPKYDFCMCNIWVILRRNIMYLYSKNLILINFFTVYSSVEVSECDLIGRICAFQQAIFRRKINFPFLFLLIQAYCSALTNVLNSNMPQPSELPYDKTNSTICSVLHE